MNISRLHPLLSALTVALMNDGIPDLPPEELEMALDEDNKLHGRGPEPRSPEQGIADMQARIKYLEDQLQVANNESASPGWTHSEMEHWAKVRKNLQTSINEAKQRLAEYQTQLKHRN